MSDDPNFQVYSSGRCCVTILLVGILLCTTVTAQLEELLYVPSDADDLHVTVEDFAKIFSPGSILTGVHKKDENIWWYIIADDIDNVQLYAYPTHMDLDQCCDYVTITDMLNFTRSGVTVKYTGPNKASYQTTTRPALKALPSIRSTWGLLRVIFRSDSTIQGSGFSFRFFVLPLNLTDKPTQNMHLSPQASLRQFTVPGDNPEIVILLPFGERVELHTRHMNLSYAEIMPNDTCRNNKEKLEFCDMFSKMKDPYLAVLCRDPYTFSPVTLVSATHQVMVWSTCSRQASAECAVIDYKIYNSIETNAPGSCKDLVEQNVFEPISGLWALEHTWNVNSNFSDLNSIWWIENTHEVDEIQIEVKENQMLRDPDCLSEKIEIYIGKCITPHNLMVSFCGGTMEVYKLTNRFAAIKFISDPSKQQNVDTRKFVIWTFAGNDTSKPIYSASQTTNYAYSGVFDLGALTSNAGDNPVDIVMWISLFAAAFLVLVA